jgi:hypothetical protein
MYLNKFLCIAVCHSGLMACELLGTRLWAAMGVEYGSGLPEGGEFELPVSFFRTP